jgi:hypothetical protein
MRRLGCKFLRRLPSGALKMTGSSATREAPVVQMIARRRANSPALRFHSSDHVGTMGRQGSAPLIGLPVRQPSVISVRGQIRRTVGPRIPSLSEKNTGSIDGENLPTINPRSSIFAEESALLEKKKQALEVRKMNKLTHRCII